MYELKKQPENELNIQSESKNSILVYNIYGCPSGMDVRIGDFTQTKIGDYSG